MPTNLFPDATPKVNPATGWTDYESGASPFFDTDEGHCEEPPDAEGYTRVCYFCGYSWPDTEPPTEKDDCGVCDQSEIRKQTDYVDSIIDKFDLD